ncbi:hypothetical protein AB0J81_13740 [Streptomyces bobili]|uniref:hypothetical protein n=1 Tax=Streptomyces bobili TaxID=67280 RepID=UPI0034300F00
MGDFGDFLKNVRDGASLLPIVGAYIGNVGPHDKGGTATSRFIDQEVLKPASYPLERTLHGMAWLYDNGVSQPMSTFLLQGTHVESGNFGDLFEASAWAKAWHVANNVSPGQAFWADHGEVEEILKDRKLYAAPPAAYLPPEWKDIPEDEQQEMLKEAGAPVIGNRAVAQMRRDSDFFKYASGTTDFAVRWWLDPTVLGLKAVSAARGVQYGRMPTAKEAAKFAVWSRELPEGVAVPTTRPAGGWSGSDIDTLMNSSKMAKAQAFIFANKDNPDLINNLSMFKKSALGPRAGSIISQLKTPDEVALFLRTTMGDVAARAQLKDANAAAGLRMAEVDARVSKLELETLPSLASRLKPGAVDMIRGHIDDLKMKIQGDEDLIARYDATLSHYAELDALNLTRLSTSRAYSRTGNQRDFRTGPAIGTVSLGGTAAKAPALAKTRIYSNDMFGSSATMIRGFAEKRPNGIIAIDDLHPEAIDELRGTIARIPGIGPNIRADLLNRYLKTTTEGERMTLLDEIQGLGVKKVAEKHGFGEDEARALYQEYRAGLTHGQEDLRRYSGANMGAERQSADIFAGHDGRLVIHPNMVTKLANDQILIDLNALDRTLARNASALRALRTSRVGNPDWLVDAADYTSHLWKFATLFRLGYIPRVLSDDLLGQTARLGAATMAARAGYGVKNLATNLFQFKRPSYYAGAEAAAKQGVRYADKEIAALRPELDRVKTSLDRADKVYRTDVTKAKARATKARTTLAKLDKTADPVKFAAMEKLSGKLDKAAKDAEKRLETHSPARRERLGTLSEQMDELLAGREGQLSEAAAAKESLKKGFRQSSQLNKPVSAGGIDLPPALAGERGEYYMKMISSDDSLRTLLQRNKQLIHSNLQKSVNTKAAAPISYPGTEKTFVEAWHKAINHQIMQDELAVQAVKGKSAAEMAHWLAKTPAGRAYRKRLGIKYDTPERIAQAVWHEVDEYMPAGSGLREAAMKSEADIDYLTAMAKTGVYPQYVHSSQLGEALAGSNAAARATDRVIDWWYKWAASLPADRMSRHPLFNQLYEGHAKAIVAQELKQGAKITQKDADRLAETARRLALKDTKKLVFDIAHRSDVGHALRFMSPFYAATTEAWQRWARIIADRPQTVGYASIFFNAPISQGWAQDRDGNRINKDGTVQVLDESTGKLVKKFVPKSDRMIMARVPKWLPDTDIGKMLGMDTGGDWLISQDSMNLITQGDPWFNPGTGPIVSIPASLLTKDKPGQAEMMRHLGVLPFGPTPGGVGKTIAQQSLPAYARNFLSAWDTSDERYQRIKLQIMQRAAYEHANLGKPMPSAKDIADQTRNYWLFSAGTAFLQPFATQRVDKYQFYRDQYNNLRRKDPLKADEAFLERFQESYFVFAQATSENESGIPATKKAVELQQKYGSLIAKNPDLAALIIGPEGNGPFSPEAYTYQLTVPLSPGGAEAQRTKLSADEAMQENERRRGWAQFTRLNNTVTAQLHSAGFDSFEDEGAERFKSLKSAISRLLGDPVLPDGSENPYYNDHWSREFFTVDPKRYDRLIPALEKVANSELSQLKSRSDLRRLQEYLSYRKGLTTILLQRQQAGGAKTLKAKSNADLAMAWNRIVDGLVESDTNFGDLYHRYLSRDLGVNTQQDEEQEEEEGTS